MKIYGSKAQVYLKYEGSIKDLSQRLSKCLILPNFDIDTDRDPPHEVSGSCEAMGFELWIEKSNALQNFSYLLKVETELSLNESFNDQMYDISPWLARYISQICEIESCVLDPETESYIILSKGNT